MTWIDEFLLEVKEAETPTNYLYWGAIASISAIAAPLVYLNRGGLYKLRPNLYILLMGPSGLGKAFAITTAKKIVGLVGGTRIITGRATIEAIIRDLSVVKSTPTGIGFKDARGFVTSGEFAASIHKNSQALDILTDLFDAHDNPLWKNNLKTSPVEFLNHPCITLFSGANDDMFHSAIPEEHLKGGFVGRLMLPASTKKAKFNSLVNGSRDIDYERLACHLKEISKIEKDSSFQMSDQTKIEFDDWYQEFQERAPDFNDKTGFINRLHDHVLKVAMCISLSRKLDLVIEVEDFREANEAVADLLKGNRQVSTVGSKSESSSPTKVFFREITKAKDYTISRRDILSRSMGEMDSNELNKVVETLVQAGYVYQPTANETHYRLTPTFIEIWEKRIGKTS